MDKMIKSPLEVQVVLHISGDMKGLLSKVQESTAMEDVFLCSQVKLIFGGELEKSKTSSSYDRIVELEGSNSRVRILVEKADGHKCPRCWKYSASVDEAESVLCDRCSIASGINSLSEESISKLVNDA